MSNNTTRLPRFQGLSQTRLDLRFHSFMGMTVEEIVQQYPHLRPSDVHDALAYAYDHLEEIDTDLAADDEEMAKAKLNAQKME